MAISLKRVARTLGFDVVGGHMAKPDQHAMILLTDEMKDWFGKALEPGDDFKVNDKEVHPTIRHGAR
ncbi:hypothetical protein PV04_02954 [Phialophora macrospora]|uniref:Uncharacterized protein n=1 Tax=Phialophora macrospora TaxID=1851006 RepID=A0A0D2FW43_9EURO|nr:hypothetical protein PV04_02954 [Phialophora macrospora]